MEAVYLDAFTKPEPGEPFYVCERPMPEPSGGRKWQCAVVIPARLVDTAIRAIPSGALVAMMPLTGPMVCAGCGMERRRVQP